MDRLRLIVGSLVLAALAGAILNFHLVWGVALQMEKVREESNAQNTPSICTAFDFHFIKLKAGKFGPEDSNMTVSVFMDEAAFNRNNLVKLFDHFDKEYQEARILNVIVYTKWSDLNMPAFGDCPLMGMSGGSASSTGKRAHYQFRRDIGTRGYIEYPEGDRRGGTSVKLEIPK
ncbi:MAG: hypothetical protein R2684_10005 [Pyrinomonadaceae bacterium]